MGGASWRRWKYLSGVAVCFLFAWIAFVRKTRSRSSPWSIWGSAASFAQIAVPVGLAAYFLLRREDRLGGALCLAWAATSAKDVAVYIADAPYQRLQLIGGEHDWAAILGPDHFNALDRAGLIAAAVRWFGLSLLFAAFAICVWTIVLDHAPPATEDRGRRSAGDGWAWSTVRR